MSLIVDQLPPYLQERTRPLNESRAKSTGFVLYWMRTAMRAEENPALDVACSLSRSLKLPVFVYQGLSEGYPYASDRHHTFILEGVRDVQEALRERGVGYAFHLERPGHRSRHLEALTQRAALVVTEDMPVSPLRDWAQRLATEQSTAVWAVDTSCVYPMNLVGRAFDRAFEFRSATKPNRDSRLEFEWPSCPHDGTEFYPDLPFEPVDMDGTRISDLVGACEIDHGIPPIPHTRGGIRSASSRWIHFRDHRMSRYSRDRNDPLIDATSRMSSYLHYGMISPFQLARESHQIGGAGAEKYLDELLIWRELSYVFCRFRPNHDQWSAVPEWARQTLEEHRDDTRTRTYSWEDLSRGRTDDVFWNACQQSLWLHGEIHNNVRMTWGKAFLEWAKTPEEALAHALDLNHRFALDGRDPASYGGILWCFGLFDRPFAQDHPVSGTLRGRPTSSHQSRLDFPRYQRKVQAPSMRSGSVAVIGAGLSGLAAARCLQDHGHQVAVFEKSRGTGGRAATRRTATEFFNHGAPFFKACDERFLRFVRSWIVDDVVQQKKIQVVQVDAEGRRSAQTVSRFVGSPTMSALGRHLGQGLDVRFRTRVTRLVPGEGGWILEDEAGKSFGPYSYLVVAIPAPQALTLVAPVSDEFASELSQVRMNPCFALFGEGSLSSSDFDVATFAQSPIHLVTRELDTEGGEKLCVHMNSEWTMKHLDRDRDQVATQIQELLKQELSELSKIDSPQIHLWRYATVEQGLLANGLMDHDRGLAICGDAFTLPGAKTVSSLERAWLSGVAVAGAWMRQREVGRTSLKTTTLFDEDSGQVL